MNGVKDRAEARISAVLTCLYNGNATQFNITEIAPGQGMASTRRGRSARPTIEVEQALVAGFGPRLDRRWPGK